MTLPESANSVISFFVFGPNSLHLLWSDDANLATTLRLVVDDCGLRGFGGSGGGLCHAPPKTPCC